MTDYIKKLKKIKEVKKTAMNLLFPVRCPYCAKVISANEYACDECKKQFPKVCLKGYAHGGYLCSAPFPYYGIFCKAVKQFKFNNRGGYAKQLAFPVVQSILEIHEIKNFDMITCVPMHKNLLKERRYNQAELLARECSEIMNIPYVETLEKFKENKAQHSIKAAERADNVKGVYKIIDKQLVKNKNILIIDDIITTGHTLGECSRILMKSGCNYVGCAVLCMVTIR